MPQLAAIAESDEIEGLLVLLNTVGGDIETGLAIAELIASMKKPTVSLVLGDGHSIGVPLAVAAGRSIIAPSATMTIHRELAADVGSVIDGEEAVKLGLIDQLGGLSDALAYLHEEIGKRREK